ncbi:MAG TPA: 50S ribosomal protein L1 [Armatimonadota bacterium]|nr:50S ribosomal protein L1 [Armatimonadota bacterium]
MKARTGRYREAAGQLDKGQVYEPSAAVEAIKKSSNAKFDETIDVAIRLGVDPRHGDQMVRGIVTLPHGTGRKRRVAVFAKGDKVAEAEEAGADVVGSDDLIQQIQGGWREFDVLIATPDMMPVLGRSLGRVLGPKMPSPKSGTVTQDVGRAIRDIKQGAQVEYRVEKAGIVHAPIGKVSFPTENLIANLNALMGALQRAKPASAKGQYFRNLAMSSTMGPAVKVDPGLALAAADHRRH